MCQTGHSVQKQLDAHSTIKSAQYSLDAQHMSKQQMQDARPFQHSVQQMELDA